MLRSSVSQNHYKAMDYQTLKQNSSYQQPNMEPDFQLFSSLRYDPLLLQSTTNTQLGPQGSSQSPTPFYMLAYHRDRILQAAEHFKWEKAIAQISGPDGLLRLLKRLEDDIDVKSSTPLRVRILLHYNGTIKIEASTTPAVPLENLFPSRLPPLQTSTEMKISPLTGGALTAGMDDTIHGDPQKEETWAVMPDSVKTIPSPFTTYKTTSRDMYTGARERVGIVDMVDKREVLIVSDIDGAIMEGSLTSFFCWRNGQWTTPPVSSGGQVGTTRRWLLEKGFCIEGVVRADSLVDGEECWISNGVRGLNWGKIKLS